MRYSGMEFSWDSSPRQRRPGRRARGRGAFSLVELLMVIVIMGILAAAALPALRSVSEANRAGAASDVERLLTTARTRAMLEGRPVGVRLRPWSCQSVWIAQTGAWPTGVIGMDGAPAAEERFESRFAGVAITAMQADGAAVTDFTAWFGHDGAPQRRASNGTLQGGWSSDLVLTFTGGEQLRVRRMTGAIER